MSRLKRFSNWQTLRIAIAFCLRFKNALQTRIHDKTQKPEQPYTVRNTQTGALLPVDAQEVENAGLVIMKLVQREVFATEFGAMEAKKRLTSGSPLYRLDPFLDEHGVIRVGGRLIHAALPYEVRHPIVLPKEHDISKLIAQYYHERTRHQGRGIAMNEIRSHGVWILGCRAVVTKVIWKCVTCRRLRGECQQQKMADLPEDRTSESPPFTYAGVDLFGPWIIKEGRKELKRYGVIFTCLASRAVHIEVASSLSTDSFINALRRTICTRGPIRVLRCDQGTNFVGAKRELSEGWTEMDQEKISKFMRDEGGQITFKMNTPHSSHMGGVWERQIRSIRNVLATLMHQASGQLDDESLRTFMCEAMAIVNSRPLTVDNIDDPLSPTALSPNQLLTMKSNIFYPPPGNFQREDSYSRKRWRRVQYLSEQFWTRWRKEYLQNLQTRQKWQRPKDNLQIGDVVLVKDTGAYRGDWPLARVHEVVRGQDSYVRKVVLQMGDRTLDKKGKRTSHVRYLDRPIHKVVLLYREE
jgi:hypothetical protein